MKNEQQTTEAEAKFNEWLTKKQFQVTDSTPSKETASMLIQVRGLKIHAKRGKGGVVNLVVGTDEEHTGMLGRLRQHLANALFRAADLCYPGNHNSPIRVVRVGVPSHSVNDGLTHLGDTNALEVRPLHLSNGDAYYNAFLIHEGVKGHQQNSLLVRIARLWRKKGADDSGSHSLFPLVIPETWNVTTNMDPDTPAPSVSK